MADFKIGNVIHYYDKLGVAIIELDSTLGVGDVIRFSRGGEEMFTQEVESIQVEHQKKQSAGKGETVGIKVAREVKEGTEVFNIQETAGLMEETKGQKIINSEH